MYNLINKELLDLENNLAIREFHSVPKGMINLSSNDYLGISNEKELFSNFLMSISKKKFLFSSLSSRLQTGTSNSHLALENKLSELFSKECLIFNSGYHANIGILNTIAKKGDLIIADKYVHASIIDGIKLSEAELFRYNHNNYKHLRIYLEKNRNKYKNAIIITESLFSMDGDLSDFKTLIEIKKTFNCLLYIDEAHSFGVYGNNGLGLCEQNSIIQNTDIIIGTFGKALASYGAFAIINKSLKNYLINKSRSLIYSTALPPINAEWTLFLLNQSEKLNTLRNSFLQKTKYFTKSLNINNNSYIIPIILGSNKSAIDAHNILKKENIFCLPIRYPTVPKGSERLRISLTNNLTITDIDKIINIIKKNDWKVDK